MIPRNCKRLAEVGFPIAQVSRQAVREKSIRRGHPSTLHPWWARRPLASSRAILTALLLPDPCDAQCPKTFKEEARHILLSMYGRPPGETSPIERDEGLRRIILRFIADFANWDNAAKPKYLKTGQALVRAAHPGKLPLVADPFAGGGSIPLEALRLGCEAFASDLNPVACLILKVMLEDVPRHGPELVDGLRRAGAVIRKAAESKLAGLFPADPDSATPIACLWARTVRCEAPGCGAEIPLVPSMWLSRRAERKRALHVKLVRAAGEAPRVEFEVFEPKRNSEVRGGTITRGKASCICCGTVLSPERVRTQLVAQRGGADVVFDDDGTRIGGAMMTAVVTVRPGERVRHYRPPTGGDYAAVRESQRRLQSILEEWEHGGKQGLCPVPDEPFPIGGGSGAGRAFGVRKYGMATFGDLFTARQKVALVTLGQLTFDLERHGQPLALALTRSANTGCALCRWQTTRESLEGAYSKQALPMAWDFGEGNPLSESTGGYSVAIEWVKKVVDAWPMSGTGRSAIADAARHPLPDASAGVWFTDPPYYDAVPYADLSDFFLVWLKRVLPGHPLLQDPFDPTNALSPKGREAVQDETRKVDGQPKNREWFENAMAKAFAEGRRVLREDGIGSLVLAHETIEGSSDALLSGMIRGGWTITGSWPIATEAVSAVPARATAARATSLHLVCRPRSEGASIGDWADVRSELPRRLEEWMQRLQGEGVHGADLIFACIGPALEVFSRYSRVETPDGHEVVLSEYLEVFRETVGREALRHGGDA